MKGFSILIRRTGQLGTDDSTTTAANEGGRVWREGREKLGCVIVQRACVTSGVRDLTFK